MNHRIESLAQYNLSYKNSIETTDKYWTEIAESYQWKKKWNNIQSGDFHNLDVKWFDGAELNITENCLDRHVKTQPNKIAIHWEPNDPTEKKRSFTYKELLENVNQFANVLKDQNVKKGDRVIIYMSMVPELLFGVLACARIGAVHSVVFGGFSANALSGRINDCQANIIITNDEGPRGAKAIGLKNIVDEACKDSPGIKKVLVLKRTGNETNFVEGRDIYLNDLLAKASRECEAEVMQAEDPLFILYTSGSTGAPKGLQHTIAGYMVWTSETFKNVFQVNENDVYWCTADIGWITGHSYISYGPLLNGVTQVIFEGIPTFPDAGRFWEVVDNYKVSHLYTAPTAIRALQSCDESFVTKADLSSLKVLGTVGEPINEEAWDWYFDKIGKKNCPIVDTWWQTETAGIMISNLAGVTPALACHATLPQPGVNPILVDSDGNEVLGNPAEGNLCIDRPWPGIARTIYGDHSRYEQTYFSTYKGKYFTGDGARRDHQGNDRITGRVDDVINVSGHRIGTAEVEDAINEHLDIVESAVVGFPHEIKGQAIMAYIIPQGTKKLVEEEILKELNDLITKSIGPIAKIDKVLITKDLPKTRSGKIMRRILRKLAAGEFDTIGDTSTLLNPEIVESIKVRLT